MKLGSRIRQLRGERSLAAIGKESSISISYLSDIERGRTVPSLGTLEKLAKALDKTAVGLLLGTEYDLDQTNTNIEYDYDMGDGRKVTCLEVAIQSYPNCEFSAGLINNLPPEEIYIRLQRNGQEPSMWFMTRDEVLALVHVMSGALWSQAIADKEAAPQTAGLRKRGAA